MLVLLRHGESRLNREGRFSGWSDTPLTPEGVAESHQAGLELRAAGIAFDACFTSVLSRAVDTAAIVLGELGLSAIPVFRSWKLNERNYGILEGLLKSDAVVRYGTAKVDAWRNSLDALPPQLADDDPRHPRFKAIYGDIPRETLPASESLRAASARVVDYYESAIRPAIAAGKRILVVSHGNPLRALIAHLSENASGPMPQLSIKNAVPLFVETI